MSDLTMSTRGTCRIDSPLRPLLEGRKTNPHSVEEKDRVLYADAAGVVDAAGRPRSARPPSRSDRRTWRPRPRPTESVWST